MLVAIFWLCLPSVIENQTSEWTEQDQAAYERAASKCQKMDPEYPCMKKFIKVGEHRYQVWCSKNDKRD